MASPHTASLSGPSAGGTAPHRDRTHWLYLSVIAAVVAGVVVGLVAPDVAKQLKPLGTAFVALIKMMISPIIFCTIVLGVGSVRQAARVGRVGGLALADFLVMSTVALAIGLVVGNLLHPGSGLHLTAAAKAAGGKAAGGESSGTIDAPAVPAPPAAFPLREPGQALARKRRRGRAGPQRAEGAA